jgi:hypothetical protein
VSMSLDSRQGVLLRRGSVEVRSTPGPRFQTRRIASALRHRLALTHGMQWSNTCPARPRLEASRCQTCRLTASSPRHR